jgi:DNA-binding transcriptional ArsR family regulator
MSGVSGMAEPPHPERLQEAAGVFALLASPVRLHLVWVLCQGECDVSGLTEQVGAPMPAVSQHLAKLKRAGIVRSRRQGRRQVYVVDDPGMAAVVQLMLGHEPTGRRSFLEGLGA